jgi:hypothetical protein
MSHLDDEGPREDLSEIVERLRDNRTEASASDLDRIKLRAIAQASSPRKRGPGVRTRSVVVAVSVLLMAGGTGAVLAAGGGLGHGNAANSQYKPGCGPKKTNGVNPSGTHTGQPPKAPNREDCPH